MSVEPEVHKVAEALHDELKGYRNGLEVESFYEPARRVIALRDTVEWQEFGDTVQREVGLGGRDTEDLVSFVRCKGWEIIRTGEDRT